MSSLAENFESKFVAEAITGCFLWMGATTRDGYGAFWDGERTVSAHRYSYVAVGGSIGAGLVIDHKCRNKSCVNPDHLEPVTVRENTRRGVGPTAQHMRGLCKYGHQITDSSTYRAPKTGKRRCRECRDKRFSEWYKRNKA